MERGNIVSWAEINVRLYEFVVEHINRLVISDCYGVKISCIARSYLVLVRGINLKKN